MFVVRHVHFSTRKTLAAVTSRAQRVPRPVPLPSRRVYYFKRSDTRSNTCTYVLRMHVHDHHEYTHKAGRLHKTEVATTSSRFLPHEVIPSMCRWATPCAASQPEDSIRASRPALLLGETCFIAGVVAFHSATTRLGGGRLSSAAGSPARTRSRPLSPGNQTQGRHPPPAGRGRRPAECGGGASSSPPPRGGATAARPGCRRWGPGGRSSSARLPLRHVSGPRQRDATTVQIGQHRSSERAREAVRQRGVRGHVEREEHE